jgi:transposase
MSVAERDRLDVFARVKRKELTVVAAAELLGLSLRQGRRVWKRFKADGAKGLVHALRGRASNRCLPAETAQRVVKLQQEKYADFGPTLACEKLASEHGLAVSPDTLVGLLKQRGLWVRRRRRGRHRRRRERRCSLGSMVQMDGSHHDWFEGRGEKCVLMVMIDDATSLTHARFYHGETTESAFDVFGRWIGRQGVPRSVYVDRHSIYRDEDHPDRPTQFGRAMKQLGVELIQAHSPQAKGRVERRHAVFQDRLVKEMRLRGISRIDRANDLLEEMFIEEMNHRYAVKAVQSEDMHRELDKKLILKEVLCVIEQRVVGQDWCVRWRNRWLQIDAQHQSLRLAGRKVMVKHLADGTLVLNYKQERLVSKELAAKPKPPKTAKVVINNRKWTPSPSHPWKAGAAQRLEKSVLPAPYTGREEKGKKRLAG